MQQRTIVLYQLGVLIVGYALWAWWGGEYLAQLGKVFLWTLIPVATLVSLAQARWKWHSLWPGLSNRSQQYPPLSPALRRLLDDPKHPEAPATGTAPPTLGTLLAVALVLAASLAPLPALAEPPEPPAAPVAPPTPAERGMGQIEGGIGLLGVSAILAFPMAGLLATPAFGGAERQAPVIGTLLVVGVLSAIGGVWELTSGLHLRSGHAPASGSVRGRFLGLGWTLPNAENSGSGLFSLAWSL